MNNENNPPTPWLLQKLHVLLNEEYSEDLFKKHDPWLRIPQYTFPDYYGHEEPDTSNMLKRRGA